ncbi:MAG: DNA-binding protein WhiA [Candidatus Limnocylindrales bacterium]
MAVADMERGAPPASPAAADRAARELVEALRAELAAVEPGRACCRAAERAGLGAAATGHAPNAVVARLAIRLERSGGDGRRSFAWAEAAEHCRLAWLRGRFLATGSLSLAGGRSHLEFVVAPDEGRALAARLAELGLPAPWRLRRGSAVLTWKSRETIVRFLHLVGAGGALLELQARGVARSLRADLNRQLNAETANLRRGVDAAIRQLEAIERLRATGRLAFLPAIVRRVAEARDGAPEASISELAEQLEVPRASLQRALERLVDEAADRPG